MSSALRSPRTLAQLQDECQLIRAEGWVYACTISNTLPFWYPYRRLEGGNGRRPEVVGINHDVFPVGSVAVDKFLCEVLYRKGPSGWYPTKEAADMEIRTVELQIIEQQPYTYGREAPPVVTPVWFNTPILRARRGDVSKPGSQAFDGPFANPEKEKFTIRLCLVGKDHHRSKQYNLHRGGAPINRAELAQLVSKEVEHVMKNDSLRVGGRDVTFGDLVLVDVHCVSTGSVQATLGTRYYSPGPLF